MNKILTQEKQVDDLTIRPKNIKEYIGQKKTIENLKIFIKSAKIRNEQLDHCLLYGPPGLGKTTLALIISNELGTNIKYASGPTIEKSKDLIANLTSLEKGDVLFIDEIHRIPKNLEEILYSAMEDYFIDIIIGNDNKARNIRIDLPPFTLVGATTRIGDLTGPLRDRFGIVSKLDYYTNEELQQIIKRSASVLNCKIDDKSVEDLSIRSRGTPRIANRLLKRIRDYAIVQNNGIINTTLTNSSLKNLKVDKLGLDEIDLIILKTIKNSFNGGPVGLKALALSIGEEVSTIEDVYEPYLLQIGFIKRTSRGRIITDNAINYLKIE